MVRIMVGTLLDISSGKIPEDTIRDIILSKDRNNAGLTAPACGLYLNNVIY
jgi:tRNA pseudouridine38-40 synthase